MKKKKNPEKKDLWAAQFQIFKKELIFIMKKTMAANVGWHHFCPLSPTS
ncbi:hypothetical protein MHK_003691 [Candidatus Magnetomorum sp. HK-1]|nr:hypothetical protein MHK_003691 [Candidatus Magnetomorum sp. HK-1]